MTESALSISPSKQSPLASIKDQSRSTLQAAIRSAPNAAETLRRVNVTLACYFEPESDEETRAAVRWAFVRALDHVPEWAMHRAFDAWERTMQRRPSPGEIVILAERELKPIGDELARRDRMEREVREAAQVVERTPEERRRAAEILAKAGFNLSLSQAIARRPMASSRDEALQAAAEDSQRRPHWSEIEPEDSPAWRQLRESRANNPLIQASLARAAAMREAEND